MKGVIMVCLEDVLEKIGVSRTMLAEVCGVSVNSIKKYERSDTDHMRASTIEKIERYANGLVDARVEVYKTAFKSEWVIVYYAPEKRITKNDWRTTIGVLRTIAEGF